MSTSVRLGAFILGALGLLAAGVFLIGDRQFLFSRTYHLKAPFETVNGLDEGAVVRAGGVRVGTVDDIRLPHESGGDVLVVMRLEESTRGVIKRDSVATIETEGLLGSKYVSVSFGSEDSESVADGDSIEGALPMDFGDIAEKTGTLLDAAVPTMAVAKEGVEAFHENMEAMQQNWLLRGFFRRRGYHDVQQLTEHEVHAIPPDPPLKTFEFLGKDLFPKPGTAKVRKPERLRPVGRFLETTPFGMAVVTVSVSTEGDRGENLTLSKARAVGIRELLTKFRIDDTRIRTRGLGEEDGATEGGHVVIAVFAEGSAVAPAAEEDHASPAPPAASVPNADAHD